jgi:hypothetical protein
MSRSLILLGENLDNLWRRYIPVKVTPFHNSFDHSKTNKPAPDVKSWGSCSFPANEFEILNLKSPHSCHPYCHDVLGWRRWLKEQRIDQLLCYNPSVHTRTLLAAAALSDIAIHLQLTSHLDGNLLSELKLCASKVKTFNCAGRFIAQQLCRANIPSGLVTVNLPAVTPTKPDAQHLEQLRRRIKTGPGVPVLLALAPPRNLLALKPVIWSAAVVRHVLGNLRLIIAGPCSDTDCARLDNMQQTLDAQGMIHLENDSTDWDDLVNISNVVISGTPQLYDVIRLLHVRAVHHPVIAVRGDNNEFLDNYAPAKLLRNSNIRPMASALMTALEYQPQQCRTGPP